MDRAFILNMISAVGFNVNILFVDPFSSLTTSTRSP